MIKLNFQHETIGLCLLVLYDENGNSDLWISKFPNRCENYWGKSLAQLGGGGCFGSLVSPKAKLALPSHKKKNVKNRI